MSQGNVWRALLEIIILSVLIYSVLAFLRGSRGAGILRGLGIVVGVVVIIFLSLAEYLDLRVLSWLITNVLGYLVFALIVIFQPELRSAMVRVGQSPVFTRFVRAHWSSSEEEIARAVLALAAEKTGAIIVMQRRVGMKTQSDNGTRLDAQVSAPLLLSLFSKGSPLHDGAVIIKSDRVVAAGCILPLSDPADLDPSLGTRHRAALGVTQEGDAVAIVVSEETGAVSIAEGGSLLRNVDAAALRKRLRELSSERAIHGPPEETIP